MDKRSDLARVVQPGRDSVKIPRDDGVVRGLGDFACCRILPSALTGETGLGRRELEVKFGGDYGQLSHPDGDEHGSFAGP
jgi:hypothetical protein